MVTETRTLLTTGQAAKLCSVMPDTIRKWIKRGHLKAAQTIGGHHRIEMRDLKPHINVGNDKDAGASLSNQQHPQPMRCWEYLSDRGEIRKECKKCVVYHIRATQCFAVAACRPWMTSRNSA
ncbi:helix-turn-helix domain-containing protein [Planctomycetota bacterium]